MGVTFSDAIYGVLLAQAAQEGSAVAGGPQTVIRRAVREYLSRRNWPKAQLDRIDGEEVENGNRES